MRRSFIGVVAMVGLAALIAWRMQRAPGGTPHDVSPSGSPRAREAGDPEHEPRFAEAQAGEAQAGEARAPVLLDGAHPVVDGPPREPPRSTTRRIVGMVQGSGGEPIVGALVAAVTVSSGRHGRVDELIQRRHTISPRSEAATDTEGRFELLDPMAGEVALEVGAPGWLPLLHSTYVPTVGPDVDVGLLRMQVGVHLVGEVRDESGRGLEDAQLALLHEAEQGPFYAGSFGKRVVARTGPGGTFTSDTIPPGPWSVEASAAGHVADTFRGEGAGRGLVFVLQRGLSIRGRVVGTEGLDPGGLVVHLATTSVQRKAHEALQRPSNQFEFGAAPCREDGSFELSPFPRALESEAFGLEVRHFGALLPLVSGGSARPGTNDVVLAVEAPFSVTFRAIDRTNDDPISAVSVELAVHLADTGQFLGWQSAPSISLGGGQHRVRLQANPGRTQSLLLLPSGFESFRTAPMVPHAGGEVDLGRLEFTPQALDVVRVVDDLTGAAVVGAKVEVRPREEVAGNTPVERAHASGGRFFPVRSDSARTDGTGTVRLNRFPGAEVELVVEHQAYAPRRPWLIAALTPATEHRLEVSQGATLRLVVTKDGRPVEGAYVERTDDPVPTSGGLNVDAAYVPRGLGAHTRADGTLMFHNLPAGWYRFLVVEPTATVVDVHVERPGLLEHRVTL